MKNIHTWFFISFFLISFTIFIQKLNSIIWMLQEFMNRWPFILYGRLIFCFFCVILLIISRNHYKFFFSRVNKIIYRKSINTFPNRKETIIELLMNTNDTLQQLKDSMQVKNLFNESKKLVSEIERGDFRIVLFGIGSSGKTSLSRALLGKTVGHVQASMGSTNDCIKYSIYFDGLQKNVILVDTPGIFEYGHQGRIREIKARWEASRADLILFIVDKDLSSEEEDIIQSLRALGKQLILVFNKCDLWSEEEEDYLLKVLRYRCRKLIDPSDILSISSISGESLFFQDSNTYLKPEIEKLTSRIITVLNKYGEQLIINNILLQCQYLYKASQWLLNQQRQKDAQSIIEYYMWISTGITTVSNIPGLDFMSIVLINTHMVMKIGSIYGINLDFDIAKSLVLRLGRILITLGIVKSCTSIIRTALSLNTPVGIISKTVEAVTFAWLTRLVGLSFITYFQNKQKWGNMGIGGVVKYYYEINTKDTFLKHFLQVALNRIVKPLKMNMR